MADCRRGAGKSGGPTEEAGVLNGGRHQREIAATISQMPDHDRTGQYRERDLRTRPHWRPQKKHRRRQKS
ncbi:MAG TPA: hypothetical protein VF824_01695 [Thermoanaerobaculia bacterium]|jgi:hypothetical protein